jgi:uncharacterized protein (TIGR02246 family)
MKKILSIAVVLVIAASCNQKEIDTKAESEKLMQTSREWSQHAAKKDVEKIVSYWTDDAVVMSPGEPALRGKDAIRGMVEGSFKSPGFQISWDPKSAEISKSGDMGYLLETTRMMITDSTGKQTTQNFEAVTIWKKQPDDSWKCAVDVLSPVSPQ